MPEQENLRNMIQSENEMINHRMNWFLLLQGFMLAGMAFGWDKSSSLCYIFGGIGVLSSLSVGILLRYSILTIKKLNSLNKSNENPIMGRSYDETNWFIRFLLPWYFLPPLFAFAWILIIVTKFVRIP